MTIRAKRVPCTEKSPCSWFRVCPGQTYDLTFQLSDSTGNPVEWAGHEARFRVYSQFIDRAVVLEITDPERCVFGSDGMWRLQLTADETDSLPRGGMRFTLEHRESPCGGSQFDEAGSDTGYALGILGGVSCSEAIPRPHLNRRAEAVQR
ncbi:hypothetical protein [Neorhodopirellula lusitana]|uniref:hypothetical protein n=1 Tax=Neorhodopirellula lusitana TaxID=445327 RepID=UPI00384DE7CF